MGAWSNTEQEQVGQEGCGRLSETWGGDPAMIWGPGRVFRSEEQMQELEAGLPHLLGDRRRLLWPRGEAGGQDWQMKSVGM